MPWTQFMDMHSGGGQKEPYEYIYIEAPEDEAVVVFYNRFGHNPERVTCTCCGDDYSITESPSLEEASAFNRGCAYDRELDRYVEKPAGGYGSFRTVDEYMKDEDVLVIRASEIKPSERKGDVPTQGYVWADD